MPMFVKKPVKIEARCFEAGLYYREKHAIDLANWCGGTLKEDSKGPYIVIPTFEGDHRADLGDWIIKGVEGEFYPCKPSVFEKTYKHA